MGVGLGRSHKAGISDSRTFTGTSEEVSGKEVAVNDKIFICIIEFYLVCSRNQISG